MLVAHWLRPRIGGGICAFTCPSLVGPWLCRWHGGLRTPMFPGPRRSDLVWFFSQDLENSHGNHAWLSPGLRSSLPSHRTSGL